MTTDADVFKGMIDKLTASGGGDIPELSLSGLQVLESNRFLLEFWQTHLDVWCLHCKIWLICESLTVGKSDCSVVLEIALKSKPFSSMRVHLQKKECNWWVLIVNKSRMSCLSWWLLAGADCCSTLLWDFCLHGCTCQGLPSQKHSHRPDREHEICGMKFLWALSIHRFQTRTQKESESLQVSFVFHSITSHLISFMLQVTFMLTDPSRRLARSAQSQRASKMTGSDLQLYQDLAVSSGGQAVEVTKSELSAATSIIEDSSAGAVVGQPVQNVSPRM